MAFAIPMVSPDIKTKNVKTVSTKSTINKFKQKDIISGSITTGP